MICEKCDGSGWVITTDQNGYSSARPCECRSRKAVKVPPPTTEACIRVADLILANAPFAPKSHADMRTVLEGWIAANISSNTELERFMVYALDHMGEWRGIGGLRALLESMRETVGMEIAAAETDRKLLERKRLAALNPADYQPLQLETPLMKPFPVPARKLPASEPSVSSEQARELEKKLAEQIAEAPKRSDEERARIIAEMEAKLRRDPNAA